MYTTHPYYNITMSNLAHDSLFDVIIDINVTVGQTTHLARRRRSLISYFP